MSLPNNSDLFCYTLFSSNACLRTSSSYNVITCCWASLLVSLGQRSGFLYSQAARARSYVQAATPAGPVFCAVAAGIALLPRYRNHAETPDAAPSASARVCQAPRVLQLGCVLMPAPKEHSCKTAHSLLCVACLSALVPPWPTGHLHTRLQVAQCRLRIGKLQS